ncbi:MAG: hypothetical protein K0S47_2426 [Herbinix sp.]|nr:hypothetical protein [Herbinix sp.]
MKVSVIVPYHEEEAYLRDCLDSLKEQSYKNMEVLLVCDQVKESSLQWLSEYQEELSIRVLHLKNKTGVAAARNLGLENADGDYIYFIDSDDYLYGNTIESLVIASQDRDDDIIYGKKKWTWFQRSIYLARKQEQENGDTEEENEESSNETSELAAENGTDGKESKTEESSEEEDADDSSEDSEEAEDTDYSEDSKSQSTEDDENNIIDENLTPEELEARELRRTENRKKQAYRILITKRKGVRNISVLNILFKRSFIEANRIRFPEQFKYFSDIPFLLEAMSKTDKFKKRLGATYIKRKHNDKINLPALSQIKDPNRFYEYMDSYYDAISKIPADSDLRNRYDKKIIDYYCRVFAPRLKRSSNDAWRNENFIRMSEIVRGMNPDLIRKMKGYRKRLIKALVKQNVNKSLRIVKVHLGYKKLKKILKNKRTFAKFLYVHSFLKKPMMDNWILFESFFGKNYSDSPKYIYEYLAKNYPGKYKFIWVIDKKNTKIPFKHTKIKRFSLRYSYYLARCKYFVFNGRQPDWMKKRKDSVFLETWHGTPLKKLVFDQDDISSANPKYKEQVYKQSRVWDYLIAPNAFSSEVFRRCFIYDKAMLDTGYPRNDILHAKDRDEIASKIRKKLNIPKDKKTILYAPTWRDDEFYAKGQYKFELHLDLAYLREKLGDQYVLLLRTHYFIADSLDVSSLGGFAVNVSKYDDISELYLISDILITDYSSVFFDYANLRRPMLFFTYDLEKYRDVLRGFYIDIEKEVPGPLVFTTEEVADAILNINTIEKQYRDRYC